MLDEDSYDRLYLAMEYVRGTSPRKVLAGAYTGGGDDRDVLEVVSEADGDASETALDLRRSIGILLFSQGRRAEAEGVLDALHEDMCLVLGENHEETLEIAAHLARLRGPAG